MHKLKQRNPDSNCYSCNMNYSDELFHQCYIRYLSCGNKPCYYYYYYYYYKKNLTTTTHSSCGLSAIKKSNRILQSKNVSHLEQWSKRRSFLVNPQHKSGVEDIFLYISALLIVTNPQVQVQLGLWVFFRNTFSYVGKLSIRRSV